jgi:hypothetical protein
MKPCPYCGAQYSDDVAACPTDGHQLDGPVESQKDSSGTAAPRVRCPACGAGDDYAPTVELRGSFSWLVFFAGGLFAVLLRNAGRRRKVRCNKCETLFDIRMPLSRVSLVLMWVLICPTITTLIILLVALLGRIFSR